jgi:iron complex outermembrane receptor protein
LQECRLKCLQRKGFKFIFAKRHQNYLQGVAKSARNFIGIYYYKVDYRLSTKNIFTCLDIDKLIGVFFSSLVQIVINKPESADYKSSASVQCEETGLKLQPLLPSLLLTGSVAVLVAMPVRADVVQVTGVQLNPTANGLEVILKTTSGISPQVTTSSDNQTLLIDLSNAQLNLAKGREFRAENPVQGITSVTVTPLSATSIRVTMTGTQALPKAEVIPSDGGLLLSITASPAAAEATPTPGTPVSETPPTTPAPGIKPGAPTEAPKGEEEIEIVVTGEQEQGYRVPNATSATRTDTPIRDIPQSIQVIPEQVIEEQQVIQLEEALRNVSGVTFGGDVGGRGDQFSIRGFENAPVLRDGFRRYGSFESFPEVANLERIEVLKGPASILYGEIQPGGLINLVSKKPLAEPFYEAELQGGNLGFVRPRFDISGPLTSDGSLLYRLNALYQRSDSFRGFDQEERRFFISPVFTWKISDRTDVTVSLEYTDDKRPADFGLPAFGDRVVDVPRDRIANNPDDRLTNKYLNVGYDFQHRFSENWTLRNAFRYSSYEYNYNVVALTLGFDEKTRTVGNFWASQEGRDKNYALQTNLVGKFATAGIEHTLLFGVDLSHNNERIFSIGDFVTPIPVNIFNPVYGQFSKPKEDTLPDFGGDDIKTNRLGIYVQDQLSLFDNLKLLLGLRYDTVEQETVNLPGLFTKSGEQTRNYDAFTPRLGIVYQPVEELSLYASYSRSFNPNSATTVGGDPLEPEKGEGYEVGVKAELLERRLSATLAYFDITKQNVAVTNPSFPLFSIATGEQRSQGVELDVTGQIRPGWNIIAAYAYIDAEVTADTNSEIVGNRLFNVPKHSASLWTTYEIQRGNWQGLGFGVGFNYVGEREGDLDNSFEVDSYFLTNAAIFYRRNNWRFSLNVKNLFNANYIKAAENNRSSGNYPGEPFTVIGSFSVEF